MRLIDAEGNLAANASALIGTTVGLFCVRTGLNSPPSPSLHILMLVIIGWGCVGVLATSWSLDKFGRKPTMYALVAIYAVGGILVTAAQNIGMFIFARTVHGFAGVSFIAASMS